MESLLHNPVTAPSFDAQVRLWYPARVAANNFTCIKQPLQEEMKWMLLRILVISSSFAPGHVGLIAGLVQRCLGISSHQQQCIQFQRKVPGISLTLIFCVVRISIPLCFLKYKNRSI
jgi:type III secretory pathway component EscS